MNKAERQNEWNSTICSGCGKDLRVARGWCDACRLEVFGTLVFEEWDGDLDVMKAKLSALRKRI